MIVTPEMAMASKVEHSLYEVFRTVDGQIRKKYGSDWQDSSDPLIKIRNELIPIRQSFYNYVGKQIEKRLNLMD